uniref:Zinc finger protein 569 n=1 Tax=Microcebus murinus TaxID=30608 RepID=A0A8C5W2K2_MICMU
MTESQEKYGELMRIRKTRTDF